MLKALSARIQQRHRTIGFPAQEPSLPDRYRGCPRIAKDRCPSDCLKCREVCPTGAIGSQGPTLTLDLGRCLFCGACEQTCSKGAIRFGQDYRMAVRRREDLRLSGEELVLARALEEKTRRLLGRSLKLREVSAAGCNACESDVNVLNTVTYDLGRFGIQFVASPRHADGLLITGPVSKNMELALRKTYEAVPPPKIVIAVGACAISGGPFIGHAEVRNGATDLLPVDLFIPGCPPHPLTILDGLLRILDRR